MATIQGYINQNLQQKIGLNMRRIRQGKGYSLQMVENETGISWPILQRLETATVKTTPISICEQLADLFGMTVDAYIDELTKDIVMPLTPGADAYSIDFESMYPFNLISEMFGQCVFTNVNLAIFQQRIDALNNRDQTIIILRWRYGMTLAEIGKQYGITRERVRQIESRAMHILKQNPDYLMVSKAEFDSVKSKCIELEQKNAKHNEQLNASGQQTITEDTQIKDMYLSNRSHNCLIRNGLYTASQVALLSDEEIKSIRNLGRRSQQEIYSKLISLGYSPNWNV